MFIKVAINFYYDFLKLSCENFFLLYSTFIKLPEKSILEFAAVLSLEVFDMTLKWFKNDVLF